MGASVCWTDDLVNNSLCSFSSPLSSNFVNDIFITASGVGLGETLGETPSSGLLWPWLCFPLQVSCVLAVLLPPDCPCSGSVGSAAWEGIRSFKADLLGQDTFANVCYTDLIVLCPDRADSLQTSQDVPFPAL